MSKHTPGPWKYEQEFKPELQLAGRGPKVLMGGHCLTIHNINPSAIADAHLIAAAPEMLEMLNKWRNEYIDNLGRGEWFENYSDVQRIIDKAEGLE